VVDARKSLPQLAYEWSGCIRCPLAERRINNNYPLVFGEGDRGGIMFIGEGPGEQEEAAGRPFVGPSGKVLRYAIGKLGLDRVYISNIVSCRSWGYMYNGEGQPVFRKNRNTGELIPRIKDEPPPGPSVAACLPRLHEQIYIVDPVLIVALGNEAVKALTGKPAAITSIHGVTHTIEIPGAWHKPTRTKTKRVWLRKVKGEIHAPVEQNKVRYLMVPVYHPSYVIGKWTDERKNNARQQFVEDMKRAADLYDRYMYEVHGVHPKERNLTEGDMQGLGDI
jgi:uracil-DNA glycosylase